MQTEESQPSGQRIMSTTRLTLFPALSVYPRDLISLSESETDDRFYLFLQSYNFSFQRSSKEPSEEKCGLFSF